MRADVSGVDVVPVRLCGVLEGVVQEVGVVVTCDPELIGEESIEVVVVGIDMTSVVGDDDDDDDTGVAVMLGVTSVATVTLPAAIDQVVGAAGRKLLLRPRDFALRFHTLFRIRVGGW